MALLGGRDSGGWLVVTFVLVPSEGMNIWRGKSYPRPFEGVYFSSIPSKIWGGWGPVGSNWTLCSDGPALVRFPHRRIWRLLWDRFGLDDVYSGRGLKWNFWRLVANDTELALAAPCSFGIWRGLFIILSLDLFARFEISYLKIVIRKVTGKAGFYI